MCLMEVNFNIKVEKSVSRVFIKLMFVTFIFKFIVFDSGYF